LGRDRVPATAAAVVACAFLSSACGGQAAIASGLTDGALLTLRRGMRAGELRAALGEPLAVVARPGAPRPGAAVSRWTYAAASCRASVGLGCHGVHAEATFVGEALQVFYVTDAASGTVLFECGDVECPKTFDQGHLRFLLERQRGR
jgi:hypothetical protein